MTLPTLMAGVLLALLAAQLAAASKTATAQLQGRWQFHFNALNGPGWTGDDLCLTQRGDQVLGVAAASGLRLDGIRGQRQLTARWVQGRRSGTALLTFNATGSGFTGAWNEDRGADGGTAQGRRLATVCKVEQE